MVNWCINNMVAPRAKKSEFSVKVREKGGVLKRVHRRIQGFEALTSQEKVDSLQKEASSQKVCFSQRSISFATGIPQATISRLCKANTENIIVGSSKGARNTKLPEALISWIVEEQFCRRPPLNVTSSSKSLSFVVLLMLNCFS